MKKISTLLRALLLFLSSTYSSNAQWIKTNGPEGIYVTSFLNDDTTLLCGTYAQGVYRSPDHGSTWIASNTGLELKWVNCFAKDSLYTYAGIFGEGVYRSADNGHTWQPANTGIQVQAVQCLLVAGGYLFAGTVGTGMYRSPDHGDTWVDANGGALGSSYIHAMVYQNTRLMAEADNYIFYSYDAGDSWNVDQGTTAFYVINNFYQEGDTILATAGNTLFRTTDGGVNWSSAFSISHETIGFGNSGDTLYAGGEDGVYRSLDFGNTWTFTLSSGLRHGARELSAFVVSGPVLLLGYEEIGVYQSKDKGLSWQQTPLADFARGSTIDDAMTFADGVVYTGTHSNGVYKTSDQGNSWTKTGTPAPLDTLSNEVVFDMLHIGSSILLAGGCGNGLFRSADNGTAWTHITAGLPVQAGTGFTCVKTLAQCGPNTLAALTEGVYYSSDSGLTWQATNLTGSNILLSGGFAVRDNIACVGIIAFPSPTGIYRSTNNGVSWTLAQQVSDIETMATGGNHTMYAGELFSAYVSNDDGLSWNSMGSGGAFTLLAWDEYVFMGNNDGVFFSDNSGTSFTNVSQGMDPYPNNAVQGLTRDSSFIYAGTYRDGVWRRPLSDFGFSTGITQVEDQKKLFTVWPNPSAGAVDVSLPPSAKVLHVYNAAGKQVFTTTLSQASLQRQSLHVNLSTLAKGVYTITLETGNGTMSEKLLLVK